LNEEGHDRAMKYGLVYFTFIPITKPGPYQIRAAILDQASGKIGTANEFLLIPKPAARGFLLSGSYFLKCQARRTISRWHLGLYPSRPVNTRKLHSK
jgi:hypothetical protein